MMRRLATNSGTVPAALPVNAADSLNNKGASAKGDTLK